MVRVAVRPQLAHLFRMHTDRKPTRSEEELPKCVNLLHHLRS